MDKEREMRLEAGRSVHMGAVSCVKVLSLSLPCDGKWDGFYIGGDMNGFCFKRP